jgi:S1-C subfamily serine protease
MGSLLKEFLQHRERASVRFNNGGSGSFVSPRGLLFTNHHVGADCGLLPFNPAQPEAC